MLKFIQKNLIRIGYNLVKINELPGDIIEENFLKFYEKDKQFTMTSLFRMYALYYATKYVIDNNIEGDIVECGVFKGGSSMLSADMLVERNLFDKKLYLYDTYKGMSKPTDKDLYHGFQQKALKDWERRETDSHNTWCYSPIEEVKENMLSTGYPEEKMVFIKGKVEDTIPGTVPKKISLLHLDTDWYESTYHELVHLFPLLSKNGVLIIDDYGYWQGCREAVDQYFGENDIKMLSNRIDYNGRMYLKTE